MWRGKGDMHGGGGAWWRGMHGGGGCVVGGVCGRGACVLVEHAWQGGMHPTGMHSCLKITFELSRQNSPKMCDQIKS